MSKVPPPYIGWLTATQGAATGCRFSVLQGIQNVGSGPDNHVVITDPGVSRCHFGMKVDHTGHILADYGSRSGTFENNEKIHQGNLDDGDTFTIGENCSLQYTRQAPPPRTSPWKLVYGKMFGFMARAHVLNLGDNWFGEDEAADFELGDSPWAGSLRVYPDRVVLLDGEGFLSMQTLTKGDRFELGGKTVTLQRS